MPQSLENTNIAGCFLISCFVSPSLKYALVGRYGRDGNVYDTGYDMIEIEGKYPNPNFNSTIRWHDQMILKLTQSSTKQIVTLNFDPSIPGHWGDNITVLGLGRTNESHVYPNVLQELLSGYVPNQICNNAFGGIVTSDMICTYKSGKGQCYGDSGGPYLLLGSSISEDVQIGIASW